MRFPRPYWLSFLKKKVICYSRVIPNTKLPSIKR